MLSKHLIRVSTRDLVLKTTTKLRLLLKKNKTLIVPICPDPLAARIAYKVGFDAVALGGYALGAKLVVSEPLLTMPEVVRESKYIADAVPIPVLVDADAGFGEPIQVMRTVRELIQAGAAGISMEDQIFPKRAHYHRDYKEHTISKGEMVNKLRAADKIRKTLDEDFLIIARTDSLRTQGYNEALSRIDAYSEAGADMIMLFPNDQTEARKLPNEVRVPLVYVNSVGNRVGRPVLTQDEAEKWGYRMLRDAISSTLVAYRGYRELFLILKKSGSPGIKPREGVALRRSLEKDIGLPELYKIEELTTEKS
jgi:methylisocitrate lyase